MRQLIVGIFLSTLLSCQAAFLTFPGGPLKGNEKVAESWRFAKQYKLLQLETRPEKPYSVFLKVTVINDILYVDAAPRRKWHQHIRQDNRVRVKIGDSVYQARALIETDSFIVGQFMTGRTIYRLQPLRKFNRHR